MLWGVHWVLILRLVICVCVCVCVSVCVCVCCAGSLRGVIARTSLRHYQTLWGSYPGWGTSTGRSEASSLRDCLEWLWKKHKLTSGEDPPEALDITLEGLQLLLSETKVVDMGHRVLFHWGAPLYWDTPLSWGNQDTGAN